MTKERKDKTATESFVADEILVEVPQKPESTKATIYAPDNDGWCWPQIALKLPEKKESLYKRTPERYGLHGLHNHLVFTGVPTKALNAISVVVLEAIIENFDKWNKIMGDRK